MIQLIAVVLLTVTAATWVRIAAPTVAHWWLALVREVDPPKAVAHASLFGASPRIHA